MRENVLPPLFLLKQWAGTRKTTWPPEGRGLKLCRGGIRSTSTMTHVAFLWHCHMHGAHKLGVHTVAPAMGPTNWVFTLPPALGHTSHVLMTWPLCTRARNNTQGWARYVYSPLFSGTSKPDMGHSRRRGQHSPKRTWVPTHRDDTADNLCLDSDASLKLATTETTLVCIRVGETDTHS